MTFVGEGGIDHGGPRREFFRMLADEAARTYMIGRDHAKYMDANVTALQVHIYNRIFFYTLNHGDHPPLFRIVITIS